MIDGRTKRMEGLLEEVARHLKIPVPKAYR